MSNGYSGLNGEALNYNISGCSGGVSLPPQDVSCRFFPELTILQLATAQTTQDEEVEKKHRHLHQLKQQLKKENERLKLAAACVCTTNRAITVLQDRVTQSSLKCQTLEKAITKAVSEKEDLSRQVREVNKEMEKEERLREGYREKMRVYRERVTQVEQVSSTNKDLSNLITRKHELESKRALYMHGEGLEILSGERQKKVQDAIISTETACAMLDEEEDEMIGKQRLCEQQVHMWRRQVDMIRKRRQAQMTRLQRLLSEAQARQRQWSQQNDNLHGNITSLQTKLNDM